MEREKSCNKRGGGRPGIKLARFSPASANRAGGRKSVSVLLEKVLKFFANVADPGLGAGAPWRPGCLACAPPRGAPRRPRARPEGPAGRPGSPPARPRGAGRPGGRPAPAGPRNISAKRAAGAARRDFAKSRFFASPRGRRELSSPDGPRPGRGARPSPAPKIALVRPQAPGECGALERRSTARAADYALCAAPQGVPGPQGRPNGPLGPLRPF